MYLFQGVSALHAHLRTERVNNRTVGFVPTMGALHEGHLALVRQSLAENQVTVCSIFVNPTQFNDPADLEKYPRTPGKDLELLASVGCNVAFLPSVDEVYPPNLAPMPDIDLAGLDQGLEGAHRPGHFAGVVQVVQRFLDLVEPHRLYLGQKDFQQQLIIRHVVRGLEPPLKVVTVPTVREPNGLAMSSRNVRLPAEVREQAGLIHQTLEQAKDKLETEAPRAVEAWALRHLDQAPFRPEYFCFVDGTNLQPVHQSGMHDTVVACTAVWAGEVRLIDNLLVKGTLD